MNDASRVSLFPVKKRKARMNQSSQQRERNRESKESVLLSISAPARRRSNQHRIIFSENKRKLLERIKIYHHYAREWRRMFLLSRQEFGIPHSTAFIFHPRFHPPFSHVSFRKKGIFFLYYKCCRVLYIKMHHRKGFPFIICTWKTRKLSPSCRIDP